LVAKVTCPKPLHRKHLRCGGRAAFAVSPYLTKLYEQPKIFR